MNKLVRDPAPRFVPTKFDRDLIRNYAWESGNGLGRSKSLISSLSASLTNHVSHERTRPRSSPKIRPHQVWMRSDKNCARESSNDVR